MKGTIRQCSFTVAKIGKGGKVIKKETCDGVVCVEAHGKIYDLDHYTRRAAQQAFQRKDIKKDQYKILDYKIDFSTDHGKTIYDIQP